MSLQNQTYERENDKKHVSQPRKFSYGFSRVESGLEFMLSHFSKPWFPRKVSTAATRNEQKPVQDNLGAMTYYQGALWEDCRIAAFGIGQTKPDLIFIELDARDFVSLRAFKLALTATLKNIKDRLGGWTCKILSAS